MSLLLPDVPGYVPHFMPTSPGALNYLTLESAQGITNANERRFALLLVALFPGIVAYHEPGKVKPPSSAKNVRSSTVPDFIAFIDSVPHVIEVGTKTRKNSGKFPAGKAAQRRTLMTTGLPVMIIGDEELAELENLLKERSPVAVMDWLLCFADESAYS